MFGFKRRRELREETERAVAKIERAKAAEKKAAEDLATAEYTAKVKKRQEVKVKRGQMVKVRADGRRGCVCCFRSFDNLARQFLSGDLAVARKRLLTSLESLTSIDVRFASDKHDGGYCIVNFYEWELDVEPGEEKTQGMKTGRG